MLQYEKLKAEIQRDTSHHSNPNFWLKHPSYKAIVAFGMDVVPLIIADLEKYLETNVNEDYPGWWVMYALPEITGVYLQVGGPEVEVVGGSGFVGVKVDDVSKFWVNWWKEQKHANS